ncbi:2',5'-phosphodiesterase 12-like [Centruroides sculpturatus]|uniref:2',5'-phosphodiesterase 12-like n=1 Tax=Centruroides sculpturatus TaxID=218467 RepID=UPI000C6E413D|nr:2',5'-phosphodiesterase 12-like [Centruroides sculpturatus]
MFRYCLFKNIKFLYSVRTMCDKPRMLVRCIDDDDFLDITFRYGNESLKERQFRFRRSKEEILSSFYKRIISNINSAITKKRKKSAEQEDNSLLDIPLKISYEDVLLNEETKNVEALKEGAIVSIGDAVYEVSVNVPAVRSLKLPSSLMVGFPVHPILKLEFSNVIDCQFVWYKLINKEERKKIQEEKRQDNILVLNTGSWLEVCRNYTYTPVADDVGRKLKFVCVPKNGNRIGLEESCESVETVNAGPGHCPFEDRHMYTQNRVHKDSFRCVSYNLLADRYADSDFSRTVLFPYCPPYALDIDYRKQLFMKEIAGYNADILCLQEVDNSIFTNDLVPILKEFYQGNFSQKGENVTEGVAIFYHISKFRLISEHTVMIRNILCNEPIFGEIYKKLAENKSFIERFQARNSILQTVLLESIEKPGKRLLVGNTHLYFHLDADHIRLVQATICFKYLEHLLKKHAEENACETPALIFCGDFNSCPEFGVNELATKGKVSAESADWHSNKEEAIVGLSVSHGLKLASACGYPEYTNFTTGFKGCLDYIFYDTNNLEVEECIPFPTDEQVKQYTALPNVVFPSDHLALVSTLKWK